MKNEKLIALMEAKGISKATLSTITHIPSSTLNRIINGETRHVKMNHMQAIASALGTSVYSVFDAPAELPVAGAIRPEEAGNPLTKLLSPDESMMLYWYQNTHQEGRMSVFNKAKAEYIKTQSDLTARAHGIQVPPPKEEAYEQMTLDGISPRQ